MISSMDSFRCFTSYFNVTCVQSKMNAMGHLGSSLAFIRIFLLATFVAFPGKK